MSWVCCCLCVNVDGANVFIFRNVHAWLLVSGRKHTGRRDAPPPCIHLGSVICHIWSRRLKDAPWTCPAFHLWTHVFVIRTPLKGSGCRTEAPCLLVCSLRRSPAALDHLNISQLQVQGLVGLCTLISYCSTYMTKQMEVEHWSHHHVMQAISHTQHDCGLAFPKSHPTQWHAKGCSEKQQGRALTQHPNEWWGLQDCLQWLHKDNHVQLLN